MANSTQIKTALQRLSLAIVWLFSFSLSFSQSVSTYWKYLNPAPLGNHFFDLAYVNDQVGYACGDAGVIARTTDGGHTWVYDYIPTREALQSIQFVNETTGYAVGVNGRVVKTTNRGITWDTTAARPILNVQLNNLYFFDANTGIVVGNSTGSSAVIYKTTNGGASWTSLAAGFPVQNKNIQAIAFADATTGYVSGTSGLVAKTLDGGATWTNISLVAGNPVPIGGAGSVTAQSYPALGVVDAQTVIIGSQNNSFIVKTSNGGTNWVVKGAQTPNAPLYIPGSFQMWNIKTKGSTVAVSMGSMLGTSFDKGETWRLSKPFPWTNTNGFITFYSVDITPNNSVKMVGMYGITTDSVSGAAGWDTSYYRNLNYNPVDQQSALCVTALDRNNVLVGGLNGAVYKSTDGGATWINKSIPEFMPPLYVSVSITDMKYVAANAAYMMGSNGYVYRSLDGGLTWPDPYAFNAGRALYGMDFIDANTGWICGSNGTAGTAAVYRTTNGGQNWTIQSTPFTGTNYLTAIDFINNSTGWVVGGSGAKVFKTTDGGITWTQQTSPATISGIINTVCFANTDTGYVGGNAGKVSRTTDGGATWTNVSPAGLLGQVNKIVFIDAKTGVVFGVNGACFKTFDAGNTWQAFYAPSNDAFWNACVMAPYNSNNSPGGANLDMFAVGGRFFGALSPVIYKVRVIDASSIPAAPAIINVTDKCPGAATAKGKIINPPAFSQIDITVDGVPVLYYPNDSSFIYYVNGGTTAGSHVVRVRYTNVAGTVFRDVTYSYYLANLPPSVSISSNDADNIICAGQPVTFTATPVNGGTAPSYQWNVSGVNVGTNSNTFTYVPSDNDAISVIMISNFACLTSAGAMSNIIRVEVPFLDPVVNVAAANILQISSPQSNAQYQWYKDGQPIAGATGTSYKATIFGTYTVQENYKTCSKLSNAIVLAPKTGTGDDIILYPVPASTTLYAQTGSLSRTINSARIYDINGRLLLTQSFTNSNLVELNVSALPAALYLVKIETSSGTVMKKFVKQ